MVKAEELVVSVPLLAGAVEFSGKITEPVELI